MKTSSSSLPDLVDLTTLISCSFKFNGHKILVTWHSFHIKLQPLFSIKQQHIVAFIAITICDLLQLTVLLILDEDSESRTKLGESYPLP